MTQCLYHPEFGYYSRPTIPTASKKGDFMTSVNVGSCFGELLARRFHHFWRANGSPKNFQLIEIGAHDGSLAQDILAGCTSEFRKNVTYTIIEPLKERRHFLREQFGNTIHLIEEAKYLGSHGILVANEVLDALPLPILLFQNDQWHEVAVRFQQGQFEWAVMPELSTSLKEFTALLGNQFPNGYVTEAPPELIPFLKPLTQLFDHGLFTLIDYGLDAENLYSTSRRVGTFRSYRNHQSNAHPLDYPGEQDLTADVNFTAVEEHASQLHLTPCPIMKQSRYLPYCAKEWMLSDNPPTPEQLRQFQTLIHPSQFGSRFYMLELLKGDVEQAFPS